MINCKVELRLRCTKHYVLAAAFVRNNNANYLSSIVFTIKSTTLYVPIVTLSAKDNQKLSKLLSKEFKRSVYSKYYKHHVL